jgi:hypothetical protein
VKKKSSSEEEISSIGLIDGASLNASVHLSSAI